MHIKLLSSLDQLSATKRTQASAGIAKYRLHDIEGCRGGQPSAVVQLLAFDWLPASATRPLACCCFSERDCLELLSLATARVQDRI